MKSLRSISWLAVLLMTACSGVADGADASADSVHPEGEVQGDEPSIFAGPEGVLVAGRIWVANTNGSWDERTGRVEYGEGYVTILDSSSLEEEARIVAPWLNPQYVLLAGERVGVVCSGTGQADEQGEMIPSEDGGLLLVNRSTLEVEEEVDLPGGYPGPLAGFPGAPTVDPEGETIFIGSGTGPYV